MKGRYFTEAIREAVNQSSLRGRVVGIVGVFLFAGLVFGFLFGGGWCLKNALRDSLKNQQALNWPTQQGIVVGSTVRTVTHGNSDARDMFAPQVSVQFSVRSRDYVCEQIYFGYGSTSFRGKVENDLASYKSGSKATVFYNPDNPPECLLSPGFKGTNVVFVVVGSVLAGLGLLIGIPLFFGRPKPEDLQPLAEAA